MIENESMDLVETLYQVMLIIYPVSDYYLAFSINLLALATDKNISERIEEFGRNCIYQMVLTIFLLGIITW